MLEKIGLPAKPSMRGANWLIDASHCQGCSSQFTFFNRKHHCRRCGGLFCNSCTQQRMILRGQGDSPVRICDPCKKLEEAARFEMRCGHRNRAGKGSSKLALKHEDDVLNEILGSDGKKPFSLPAESSSDMLSVTQRAVSSPAPLNLYDDISSQDREGDTSSSISDVGSRHPEELRQQALEEKKKHRILKKEGKPDDALQAFKRGKELERQAEALELSLKKSRRKASSVSSLAATQKTNDMHSESGRKDKLSSHSSKGEKDDLLAELRELGWSDADVHDADKKPAKVSLESELSSLLGEIPKKSSKDAGTDMGRSQVLAHKKKALVLKREGKLDEAKEELKRAKVLEKQLEEQELLAEADESDDEISALIRSMDDDSDDCKQDSSLLGYKNNSGFDMGNFGGIGDNLVLDDVFEVTEDDVNNPGIVAALKSVGWTEDADVLDGSLSELVPKNAGALRSEVLSLKRNALKLQRAGNIAEAMEQLKNAKLLEQDLDKLQSGAQCADTQSGAVVSESAQTDASANEIFTTKKHLDKSPPKSKLAIQRELLGLKKKALALRREGQMDEAEEILKEGKVLERQLEELENASKAAVSRGSLSTYSVVPLPKDLDATEEDEANVTEQDMHDPALLSVLRNLGWEDDEAESLSRSTRPSKEIASNSEHAVNATDDDIPDRKPKSKSEIQKQLLSIKRKSLALRRQGKLEEAEEELRKAKVLETQMAEIEAATHTEEAVSFSFSPEKYDGGKGKRIKVNAVEIIGSNNDDTVAKPSELDMEGKFIAKELPKMQSKESSTVQPHLNSSISVYEPSQLKENTICLSFHKHGDDLPSTNGLQTGNDEKNAHFLVQSTHVYPKSSLDLKTVVDGKYEVSSANASHVTENKEVAGTSEDKASHHQVLFAPTSDSQNEQNSHQQEVLARKRRAVALKREGKLAQAREELRQAKLLEKGIGAVHQNPGVNMNTSDSISSGTSATAESNRDQASKPVSSRDRFKLQQESLAHKRQALKLRREGRMEESEAEFEQAKVLEMQLEEMGMNDTNQNKSKKSEAENDVDVEDLLDLQLMWALKAIGWQDREIAQQAPQTGQRPEPQANIMKNENITEERVHLEERIKAEKVQALSLKRAGKQSEALDALRRAKQIEKQLNLLST